MTRRTGARVRIALTVLAAPALVACSVAQPPAEQSVSQAATQQTPVDRTPVEQTPTAQSPTEAAGQPPDEGEYRAGREATLHPAPGAEAVVLLVPGGSWSSADPTGLRVLGDHLAEQGLAAVTITYGTDGTGDHYPVPLQDVTCAVSYAATQVPDVPVVVVGHSAGAHLALLAALRPDEGDCPHPDHPADAVVGLAGPYDVTRAGRFPQNLFGVPQSQDPDLWVEGNPLTWAGERPDVPVLLVHGDADRVVPVSFTTDAERALTAGGHEVAVEVLPGADHIDVIRVPHVADVLVAWVEGITGS